MNIVFNIKVFLIVIYLINGTLSIGSFVKKLLDLNKISDSTSITSLTILRIDDFPGSKYKFIEDDIIHDIVTRVQPDYSVSLPPIMQYTDRFQLTNRVGSIIVLISDLWNQKIMLSKLLSICMSSNLLNINSKIVLISPYPLSSDILFDIVEHLNLIQLTNFLIVWKTSGNLNVYGSSIYLEQNIGPVNHHEVRLDYFYPDKLRDLNKNVIKVSVYDQYPRIYIVNNKQFGLDIPFIFTIKNHLNAMLLLIQNNKTFKELEHAIAYRTYDMCLNTDFHLMTQGLNLIPLNEFDGYCALIPKAKSVPFYEFVFYPFEKEVWYVLAITIGISVVVWTISKRVNPNASVGSFLFKLYGYFVGQGAAETSYLVSQKFILQLFIFGFLILGTCYQSLLVALILEPRYSNELKTFEEVKASNLTFTADKIFITNYLMVDDQFMPNKVVPFGSFNNVSNSVNITEVWNLQYGIIFKCSMAEIFLTSNENYNEDGSKRFYLVPEKIVTTMESYASSLFNPFEEKLKFIISSVFESGIKQHWKSQSNYDHYFRYIKNALVHSEPPKLLITFEDLVGVFVLFLIGNLIAIVVFIIECIIGYYENLFSNIPIY